ncbi:MAG: CsgG/HfaB family protein [Lentisphaeria bacterium]|nr:CsgG/HfaB family protein [Lentisphaeria bacterium]
MKRLFCLLVLAAAGFVYGADVVVIFQPFKSDAGVPDVEVLNDMIAAELSCADGIRTVSREQLDRLLREKAMRADGMAESGEVEKIGPLPGADYLVSGSIRSEKDKLRIFVKTISVKSGVVRMNYLTAASGKSEEVGRQTVAAILALLKERGQERVSPAAETGVPAPDRKRPTVVVFLPEMHIFSESVLDPAAENMLTGVLLRWKFPVKQLPGRITAGEPGALRKLLGGRNSLLDLAREQNADFLIYGEAIAENGDRFGGFSTARARVEVKVISTRTSAIRFADSAYAGAMDSAPVIAGKMAIQKAAGKLAESVARALLEMDEEAR